MQGFRHAGLSGARVRSSSFSFTNRLLEASFRGRLVSAAQTTAARDPRTQRVLKRLFGALPTRTLSLLDINFPARPSSQGRRFLIALSPGSSEHLVSVHLGYATGDFHCLIGGDWFLPESWLEDRRRCQRPASLTRSSTDRSGGSRWRSTTAHDRAACGWTGGSSTKSTARNRCFCRA